MDARPEFVVIGAGPAGLAAAERLAPQGRVTLYDRMPAAGRKFLMAGRGGLNLTHAEPLDAFLSRYGAARDALAPAIAAFPPEAVRAWSAGLGQETFVGSSGRVFPQAMKASPLLRAWLRRLDGMGVVFRPRHDWHGWTDEGMLRFATPGGEVSVRADATVLALGGASWPRLGSDGAWVAWLSDTAPFRPANMGFTVAWSDHFAGRFAGQPLKRIAIRHAGREVRGEAMIDRQGIEGGAIYALSAGLREAIATDGFAMVAIDLRPDLDRAALAARLPADRGSRSLANTLRARAGLSPVAIGLVQEALHAGSTVPLVDLIKALPIRLDAPMPLARAISSAGGLRFTALDGRFMLRHRPGVFAAGEMLDWEAPTGGYLLQACLSTGVAAAQGAIDWVRGAG